MKKTISPFEEKYYCRNLFDEYIKKEIFSKILSFLSKRFVIGKRSVCNNWYKILTCDFIKDAVGPFIEPYHRNMLNQITWNQI